MTRTSSPSNLLVAAVAAALPLLGGAGCVKAELEQGRYSCDPEHPDRCPPGWSCSWSVADDEYRCFKGPAPYDYDGDGSMPEADAGPDAAVSTERCGNDQCEADELCDGVDLQGRSCVSVGHSGGTLLCNPDCTFDESGCFDCGDQVCEAWKGETAENCPDDCTT